MTNITMLICAIISLISIAIVIFAIPWVKKKFTQQQIENALNTLQTTRETMMTVQSVVFDVVNAMETIYPNVDGKKMGPVKLQEALVYSKSILEKYNMTFNEAEVRTAIEAAVANINAALIEDRSC